MVSSNNGEEWSDIESVDMESSTADNKSTILSLESDMDSIPRN